MVQLGYAISSEEFKPQQLVENARRAEEIGFSYALISDHFHPWLDSQGESPFVWSVIGGIAQVTSTLTLGTGVTAPIIRIHPVILAQAAATAAAMMPDRFFFGVGTGEYLNEHITGEHWPVLSTRQEMLQEAVELIRLLWEGDYTTFEGLYYTVENARIYTLPENLPPIHVAASGKESAEVAGHIGDGLISTAPDGETVDASLLTLSWYGYVEATHPRMASTRERILERLGRGALIFRYEDATDDGLPGGEGAFGICGFWAVESRARGGDLAGANQAFDQLLSYANDVGLFAEEIDPQSGAALGNFPQAFTHVGVINAALTLAECDRTRNADTLAAGQTMGEGK